MFTDKSSYLAGEAVNIYVKAEAIDPNHEIDELINTLHHLRENGLIYIDLVNVNDEPQLVWKPLTPEKID